MPATYYAPFFVAPDDRKSVTDLQNSPHVWVGFVIMRTSFSHTGEIIDNVHPIYLSREFKLPEGEIFHVMAIKGGEVPKVLAQLREKEVGLFGFQKVDKIPAIGDWSAEFERMKPNYMGADVSLPSAVTVRNVWDDATDEIKQRIAVAIFPVRRLFNRHGPLRRLFGHPGPHPDF